MKTTLLAVFGLLLAVTASFGHGNDSGFGRFGGFGELGFGGLGWGDYHGGPFGFGGDFGLGFYDPERTQERFQTRFDQLQTNYDEGVAGIDDFFNSDEYNHIVDKTELLTDRYGLFVSGVERSIDRLTDVISIANDDLTYFNDLLADYQADADLSAARLARIERFITHITDRLSGRIDSLTEKQTTLQTNLPTYQSFQTELDTFLTDITNAGTGTSSSLASLATDASIGLPVAESGGSQSGSAALALEAGAVPEPATAGLLAVAGGVVWLSARRRRG